MSEQRCQQCQTWTPEVFGPYSRYCKRCVEEYREQGCWCVQHGPTFGAGTCLGKHEEEVTNGK